MRIAFVGKGGSGKTTLAASFIRFLQFGVIEKEDSLNSMESRKPTSTIFGKNPNSDIIVVFNEKIFIRKYGSYFVNITRNWFRPIHNGECIGHEEIDQDFLRLFQKFIDRRLEVVGGYNLQDVLKNGWGNQTMTPTERDKFLDYLLLYVHDEFFPIIIKTYNQLLE